MIEGMTLHPDIQAAIDNLAAARQALADTAAKIQAVCPHTLVAEKPWANTGGPTRICLACRVMEEGSAPSGGTIWSRAEYDGPPILGNTPDRLVLTPTQAGVPATGSFCSLRLPA